MYNQSFNKNWRKKSQIETILCTYNKTVVVFLYIYTELIGETVKEFFALSFIFTDAKQKKMKTLRRTY